MRELDGVEEVMEEVVVEVVEAPVSWFFSCEEQEVRRMSERNRIKDRFVIIFVVMFFFFFSINTD